MKKTYILLLSVIIHLVIVDKVQAQLKLGDQPTSVQKSVILDLQGSNGRQGVWLPRITDTTDATGIDALNPPDGVMIFHSPSSQVMIRRNGFWSSLQTITKVGSTTSTSSIIEFQLGTAAGASKDLNLALNSSTGVVTLNVPDAAVDTRGVVSIGSQTFGGLKTFNDGVTVSGASANASNLTLGINSATTPGVTTDRFLSVDNTGKVILSEGIPSSRSMTINGTAYDLSANRSWNVGTLTSLIGGFGLNGGTITSSGTLSVDTNSIATRAWRQKGIDSLAILINGYVTATRNLTINGTTQDLSANRTWNVGTVTGITGGFGINGGTINTSGTFSIDTTNITTRAWRQKGIDSLAAAIGGGYVPGSRTITINGTAYDLTANRSWSVGTVTGITGAYGIVGGTINTSGTFRIDTAALSTKEWRQKGIDSLAGIMVGAYVPLTRTLNGLALNNNQTFATGTTGTDFNISSSGTTHTFNFPTASSTNRGLLSNADWTTFNNKGSVNSVTGGYGINGGTITNTGTLSIDTTNISTRAWRQKGLDSLAVLVNASTPSTRTLTINGTSYDLSANRTWSVGTVTGITGGFGINGGTINTSGTFNIDTANISTRAWRQKGLDSIAVAIGSGYVPNPRTLTINGTAYDLSANRSWSVGTVTGITGAYGIVGGTINTSGTFRIDTAALSTKEWRQKGIDSLAGIMVGAYVPLTRTLNGLALNNNQTFATGTTGTDFNISSAGTTHTFNFPTASGTNRGLLSSADWTTFNNKVTSVTGGYGINGGTITSTGTLSIDTANISTRAWRQKGLDSLGGLITSGFVPTSRTLTINGTAYDLSANRSWSVGTVTGITGAYGIVGGTINTSGTFRIDTAALSTKEWRQKGIDSLAGIMVGAYVPLTRTLNGLALNNNQTFALGTAGTDASISSSGTTHTFNFPTASATNRGLLSNADWTTFNNKGSVNSVTGGYGINGGTITNTGTLSIDTANISTRAWRQKGLDSLGGLMTSGFVPTSRTLTINGTAYDLTANRSWSVGTVTGITGAYGIVGGTINTSGTFRIDTAALSTKEWRQKGIDSLAGIMVGAYVPLTRTLNGLALNNNQTFALGTAGTDASISSSGTTHTFNFPTASSTNRGLLSSADWTTFNNKVTSVTGGYGINGGTITSTGTLSIDTANISTRAWRQKGLDSLAVLVNASTPATRTLTINGTSYDLSANRTWSVGTVTGVTGGFGINGGTINTSGTFNIDTANISTRAWRQKGLDSIAVAIGSGYVPNPRTLTINGTAYDLSANRSWSVGTVTGITGGYGINGGTVNSSGTFTIDTAALSTKEWRQKGIDSLAGIMVGAYVPLTRTLNGLALSANQTFALGTTGTDASISSSGTTHTFNFPTASGTNRGLLSSADWTTFNNKGSVNSVTGGYGINGGTITNTGTLSIDTANISTRAWRQKGLDSLAVAIGGGYVATTRTLTINGTAYDLSANRSWSVGTVTGITGGYGINGGTVNTSGTFTIDTAALSTKEWRQKGIDSLAGIMVGAYVPLTRTLNGLALSANQTFALGTTGTDASISSSGTTHTFNFPTASGTNRGLLSSADWTTFNNKVTSVTGGYGINGGTITSTGTLSIDTANVSTRAWRQKGLDSLGVLIAAGTPSTRTLTINGTSYDLTANRTWNVGTVTGITGGFGINGGTINTSGTFNIDTANISTRAWRQKGLDSIAVAIGSGYVPNPRTLTINGTAYDLSANRSWSVGTVTGITGGYGINGGTVNTSGTFTIDTAALSTKEWRQKGIDSLAGIMVGAYVPLTRTLNGLALSANQTFATGTTGTDFSISSSGTTHTFNLPTASAANRGLLSSADWTTFNNKGSVNGVTGGYGINGGTITNTGTLSVDTTNISTRAWRQKGLDSLAVAIGGGYVATTRTLTINGTAYDLSANRSWSVGTVTGITGGYGINGGTVNTSGTFTIDTAALSTKEWRQKGIDSLAGIMVGAYVPLTRTLNGLALSANQTFALGTTGTDASISSSGTTHTFNFPTASGTNRGLLSSADWTTFNNKVTSVTGGYGINGGTITSTGTLSIDTANISTRAWRQKGLDSLAVLVNASTPSTRTLTINGTSYDLSANRTWSVGTVTGITGGYGINGGTINASGTFTIDTAALSTKEWRQKGIDSLAGIMVGAYVPLTRTLNGLAMSANQTFATGTTGTDFSISSSGTTHTFNLPTASAANRGLLSSADWTTFNNKGSVNSVTGGYGINGGTITNTGTLSIDTANISTRAWRQKGLDSLATTIGGAYAPLTRTLTINGTAYDLSANRSWSVGTVTGITGAYGIVGGTINTSGTFRIDTAALSTKEWRQKGIDSLAGIMVGAYVPLTRTLNGLALSANQTFALGTTGTDASISSSGTTHTFNFPTASGTNRGLLSSADWTTFNNKGTVSSVAGGYGINGGTITTTGTLTIDTASISTRAWRQKGMDSLAVLINAGTPATRTLTINGTAYDLSANRSWSVGTVTGVTGGYGLTGGTINTSGTLAVDTFNMSTRAWRQKAVDSLVVLLTGPSSPAAKSLNGITFNTNQTMTTGTSGTDFSINSAGTTHTFNLPTASASNRGALSSADWTTFNNKGSVTSVAAGYGITGGTITTTGTHAVDSFSVATRAWRQKGVDSVAGLLNSYTPAARTLTINGTSYDLSANRSWSVGTVTSVAAGYGISGGTITTTGTHAVDTLNISSRAWRQKGVDSLVSVINGYVPATRTINGLALSGNQTFAVGTTGTDFNISSAGTTHTFNIPDASATARGLVTTGNQTYEGTKTFNDAISARVNLQAGTATAGTAPLKFTSGTNLTTPENGAMEYNGTNYYVTSGGVRYTLAKTLMVTQVIDFPNFVGVTSTTVTVTGAALSDAVVLGIPQSSVTGAAVAYTAHVSAANTVTITAINYSGGWEDPLSGTFRISVLKY